MFLRDHLLELAVLGALLVALLVKQAAKFLRRHPLRPEPHATEDDVRNAIGEYLSGRWTLDELDAWLLRATWDNLSSPALARDAELLLAEADLGHRPSLADDLRAAIDADRASALA